MHVSYNIEFEKTDAAFAEFLATGSVRKLTPQERANSSSLLAAPAGVAPANWSDVSTSTDKQATTTTTKKAAAARTRESLRPSPASVVVIFGPILLFGKAASDWTGGEDSQIGPDS